MVTVESKHNYKVHNKVLRRGTSNHVLSETNWSIDLKFPWLRETSNQGLHIGLI